jgi:hypothetical protein
MRFFLLLLSTAGARLRRELPLTALTESDAAAADDDDSWLDLDTGAVPQFQTCAPHETKYYFLDFDGATGRDMCAVTCLDAAAYAFYKDMGDHVLGKGGASEAGEGGEAGEQAPCAALGYTLYYRTVPSPHISVALVFDTYFMA